MLPVKATPISFSVQPGPIAQVAVTCPTMPVPAAAIGEAFPDFKISMFDQWNNPITSKQQVSLEARFEGAVVHKRVAIDSIEPGVVKGVKVLEGNPGHCELLFSVEGAPCPPAVNQIVLKPSTPFAGTSSLTGEAFAFRTAILGQVFKLKLITRDK